MLASSSPPSGCWKSTREPCRTCSVPRAERASPGPLRPGRYPIEAWAFFHPDGQPAPSAESTLLQLFQSTANVFELGVPATLRTLESFAAAVRVGNLGSPPYHDSLATRIAALAAK